MSCECQGMMILLQDRRIVFECINMIIKENGKLQKMPDNKGTGLKHHL